MISKRIAPCRKCGGTEIEIRHYEYTCEQDRLYFCRCKKCGNESRYTQSGGVNPNDDRKLAVRQWNAENGISDLGGAKP